MFDSGIIHQNFYSYTPDHNVIELKNHHLFVITRTLLIDMNAPKYLWGMQFLLFSTWLTICF